MTRQIADNKRVIVFYHANCLDGFAGAWAAWSTFKGSAEYRGLKHEKQPMPEGIDGRDVVFIDYCFPEPLMLKLKKRVRSLTIIDHHVSHKNVLSCADHSSFALDKSGCVLAWEYFHSGEKVPNLLLTIQDVDLFTLKRPKTLEYAACLFLLEFDFKKWDTLVWKFETAAKRKEMALLGSHLLAYKDTYVTRLLEIAEPVVFHGVKAYVVNTDIFYSEAGNRIYRDFGVHLGIAWYYKNGKIKVSLRSDGTVDVSRLALRYGGGGHVGAAAFWTDFNGMFPWKKRIKNHES